MSSLNEAKIRAARPQKKQFKLFDERGLFMLVKPSGSRLWRLRYHLNGVEKLLALGAHPDVPLKRAREKREEARKLIADGIDPVAQRKADRAVTIETFEFVAREWLALQTKTLTTDTFEKVNHAVAGFRRNGTLAELRQAKRHSVALRAHCDRLNTELQQALGTDR